MISLLSVLERSASCSCKQRSQTVDPISELEASSGPASEAAFRQASHRSGRFVLRQLEVDVTQCCAFVEDSRSWLCLRRKKISVVIDSQLVARQRTSNTCAPNSLQPGARILRSAKQRLKTRVHAV